MPVYLYCVVPAGRASPGPSLTGVSGAPVRRLALSHPSADAWVSTIDVVPRTSDAAQRRELGMAHNAVVAAALNAALTPVPARAGQVFADDDDCRRRLSERADAFAHALQRLDGMVEMTTTVALAPDDASAPPASAPVTNQGAPNAGPGLRHLQLLRDRARAGDGVKGEALAAAAELSALVKDITQDTAVRAHTHPRRGVAVSHLLARADAETYRGRLAGHRVGSHEAAVVTGPTAPYSFATSQLDVTK